MTEKKALIYGLPVLALMFLSNIAAAQFSLSGEIRPRAEYLNGYKSLSDAGQDPAFWIEQRSRLKLDYKSDKYKFGLVLQDIRVWGNTSQLNKTDGLSSIHEAWGAVLFNQNLSLKLGRQEVAYDDHRIFGNVGWAQQARSHDLAKLQYKDSTTTVDLGLAFNQEGTLLTTTVYTVANNYKTLQYLWFHKDVKKDLGVSLLFLNNGFQFSTTNTSGAPEYSVKYSQTAGTHLSYKKNKLNLTGSFYYQTGDDRADKELNAYDLKGEITYQINNRMGIGAGYELLSGTSQVDTVNKKNNSFTPFYGTNHKFNGFIDYFFVGNHINNVGLRDLYFKLMYQNKKLSAGVDVHLFSAAADILDITELASTGRHRAMNASLGTEVDLTLKYNYSKDLALQAGYSQMLGTKSMEALKGGDKDEVSNWAYLMVTFKPIFYQQENQPR